MIRKINSSDKAIYIELVEEFYRAGVTIDVIDTKNIEITFEELMKSDTYAECYLMEVEGAVAGYMLLAKTFSQEAGGMVIWIEELYVRPEYRSMGLGNQFFDFLDEIKDENVKRIRLEVEEDNVRGVKLYKSRGFDFLEYDQMVKEIR